MKRYEIICTPDQTRKALELGAPITIFSDTGNIPDDTAKKWYLCILGSKTYLIPTAEQMIGFLEEQDIIIELVRIFGNYSFRLILSHGMGELNLHIEKQGFISRKEATIAAIDAALEYLTNNKK